MESASLTRPVPLIVGALAVSRLTRLLVNDEITRPLRQRIDTWAAGTTHQPAHPQVRYFISCPWCMSPYLAAGWALLTAAAPRTAATLGAILAWSEIAAVADTVA